MLPNLSKVFERTLVEKLQQHEPAKLPDEQFGFTNGLSTVHAVNTITTRLCADLTNNKVIGTLLIDLQTAFDSVWLEGLLFKMVRKNFPEFLILITWSMIKGRRFYMRGTNPDSLFFLDHGVQQGTVSGPYLFKLFFSGILLLFGLNTLKELMAILFADDMIVLFSGRTIQSVQKGLTETANKIDKYCQTWHLKINAKKCESILFRRPVGQMGNIKVGWRDFKIKINDVEIPNNNSVKYLGVHLDNLLRLDKHVNIQLEKANKAFLANTRLFHSAHLSQKAKVICYQLLIRPIITYAAPVWFNQSASVMEKMRKFERKCLRACVNLYRTPESNYKKYYSNKTVYDAAKIPRIDNFIIKIIRDHYARAKRSTNKIVTDQLNLSDCAAKYYCQKGYVPPTAFIILDKHGLIQEQNIPVLYHIARHAKNKKILHDKLGNNWNDTVVKVKFSQAIPEVDKKAKQKQYWWTADEERDDIRMRSRRRAHLQ